MLSKRTINLINLALTEDIGSGDITSQSLVSQDVRAIGRLIAKENLIVCGNEIVEFIFKILDKECKYKSMLVDGSVASNGSIIAEVEAGLISLLTGERTVLNFMQKLSGISTITKQAMQLVQGINVELLDTRKTTPGFRELEKYAVQTGGGSNHRQGLFDAVLIKNNHIDTCGRSIAVAIEKCRADNPAQTKIEVEVRNFDELRQALEAAPDIILLDNMSPEAIKEAVQIVQAHSYHPKLEASGGITLNNLRAYAETGVNSISLGFLTHSAKAVDISFSISPKTYPQSYPQSY